MENELNLSVGQMMRYAMHIPMPEYFNKYCGKCEQCRIPIGRGYADLNQRFNPEGGSDKLKSVPIGNLLHAFATMNQSPTTINPKPDVKRLECLDNDLVNFFESFASRYRNPPSHIDPDSQTTHQMAQNAFRVFINEHFTTLLRIRHRLTAPFHG